MSSHVYCNRTLNLKRITHIGFDMDHTLVRYKSKNFEALAHEQMCKKLVQHKGYPKSVLNLKFDFKRAIRGLVIDRERGNLLKLSRYSAIRRSYHGTQLIDFSQQNRIYKSFYIDLKDKDFDKVDTIFSISFATLYAQLVDLKDQYEHQLPSYKQIAIDLSEALDTCHRDDSLKGVVRTDLQRFIIRDKKLVEGLERYTRHGKQVFVVTNSDFNYTKILLDYAINPFLKKHKSWQDLFTFVITSAQKPRFFFDDIKFQRIDPATGLVHHHTGPIKPGVYQHGSARQFTDDLALDADQILYIGDHIYGDIVRLKKDCAWRTALVVEELAEEVKQFQKSRPIAKKINALMNKKVPLETAIDAIISKRIERGEAGLDKKVEALIKKSKAIDKQLSPLIHKQEKMFNPYWGEVMRVGIEESYFAHQVERFACIYMAKLSDLLEFSPRTYFRSTYRPLPHELE
jgi:HAD superfamily 5'-nucleotidase-like hydrolase